MVAKINEKKNAIHEKPGRESSPNLLLKKVFTDFPSGEIKIGIKFLAGKEKKINFKGN